KMFTGIIEEKGIVKNIQQNSQSAFEFKIKARKILEDINIGDSISIDGVCLTVTNFTDTYFQVDIMPETVKATSIRKIKEKKEINSLEVINICERISIYGVYLTVTNFTKTYFQVDIIPETVKATRIKTIKENQEVNLKRAMLAATRLGSHFVTEHVDGIGKII